MASSSRERIRIALAQINCTVGDLAGNASRIRQSVEQARTAGADLVLAPELALCGYPPEDLLLREGFFNDCRRELERLAAQIHGVTAVVGFPELYEGGRYNSAAVIRDGRIVACARKHDLPNYEVFDEKRYFSSWNEPCIVEIKGIEPVGSYAVQLSFSDGHDTGIYSWDYLYDLGENQAALWDRYLARMKEAGASREPMAGPPADTLARPGSK